MPAHFEDARQVSQFAGFQGVRGMNTVSLESLHPLVARTLEDLKTAEPDDYGLLWTCRDSLNVTLSKESLLRGMLLMDSLIKKLGSRGYGVEIAIEDEKRVLGLSCRNGGEF